MKNLKIARNAVIALLIYWIAYNTAFGWNMHAESELEETFDTIFKVILFVWNVIYFLPLIGVYEDAVKRRWKKKNPSQAKERHWYDIKLQYRNSHGEVKFDYWIQIGLVNQGDIIIDRTIKSIDKPLHIRLKGNRYAMSSLDNGKLVVQDRNYLGYFVDPQTKK